jgi:hypothetical protein
MRKTPIKHIVKAHKREGKTVYSYNRGHGQNHSEHLADPTLERNAYREEAMSYGRKEAKIFKKIQQIVFEKTGIQLKKRHIYGGNYLSINNYSPEVDKVMKELGWKENDLHNIYTHCYRPDPKREEYWIV